MHNDILDPGLAGRRVNDCSRLACGQTDRGNLYCTLGVTLTVPDMYTIARHFTLLDFRGFVSWTWLEEAKDRVSDESHATRGTYSGVDKGYDSSLGDDNIAK